MVGLLNSNFHSSKFLSMIARSLMFIQAHFAGAGYIAGLTPVNLDACIKFESFTRFPGSLSPLLVLLPIQMLVPALWTRECHGANITPQLV